MPGTLKNSQVLFSQRIYMLEVEDVPVRNKKCTSSITSALMKIRQIGITVGHKGRMFKSPRIDNEKWKPGEVGAIKKFYRGDQR